MKILSSFDTSFRDNLYKIESDKYWEENVYIISHGRFYYYFYIMMPIIFTILSIIIFLILVYFLSKWQQESSLIWIIALITILLTIIPIIFKLIKKYIDYLLDFVIITPEKLISYDQEWILSRKWRTIDNEKIKTITVNKSWLLRSIFNFWNIIVLTEWDEKGDWEIDFSFIDDPDKVKFKLLEIIESK